MAVSGRISSGFLFRRKIDKLAGGAVVDWDSGPVVEKIETAIAKMNHRGALRVKRKARSILAPHKRSGDLSKSIKAYPSKYQYSAGIGYQKKIYTEWVIYAGNEKVDYAGHVELGWATFYDKERTDFKARSNAIPFMRSAAADTRKWMRPRMVAAIKRALA